MGAHGPAAENARAACGDAAWQPNPTLILDSCSARANRGGDLTGRNPTDRGTRGTEYHVAVNTDGVPVACVATAADVNNIVLFERLFLAAFAVMAPIRNVFADCGYDAKGNRAPCRTSTSAASRTGQAWASSVGRWSAEMPGCWRTSASPCAMTGLASSFKPCSKPYAYSWLQDVWPANCESRL